MWTRLTVVTVPWPNFPVSFSHLNLNRHFTDERCPPDCTRSPGRSSWWSRVPRRPCLAGGRWGRSRWCSLWGPEQKNSTIPLTGDSKPFFYGVWRIAYVSIGCSDQLCAPIPDYSCLHRPGCGRPSQYPAHPKSCLCLDQFCPGGRSSLQPACVRSKLDRAGNARSAKILQSQRVLLWPSPGWKHLLAHSYLRIY